MFFLKKSILNKETHDKKMPPNLVIVAKVEEEHIEKEEEHQVPPITEEKLKLLLDDDISNGDRQKLKGAEEHDINKPDISDEEQKIRVTTCRDTWGSWNKNWNEFTPRQVAELIKEDHGYCPVPQKDKKVYVTLFFDIDKNKETGKFLTYTEARDKLK